MQAFKDPITQNLISKIGMLCIGKEETKQPITELVEQLRVLLEGLSTAPGFSQPMTYYQLSYSTDPSSCLQFSEMTNDQITMHSSHMKCHDGIEKVIAELGIKVHVHATLRAITSVSIIRF